MPLCTFKYLLLGNVLDRRCRTKLNPVLAIPPSSAFLQTDESGNLPESKISYTSPTASICHETHDSLFRQANTVGVIGGVSADSTLIFMRKIVEWSSKDGFPFLLCSDPVLSKQLLLHERVSLASRSRGKSESLEVDDRAMIIESLRRKRIFLENSGAGCIVMDCHIAHSWHDEVSDGCSVPVLHMGECVANELKEASLKPLEAGSPLRIGLLATNAILSAGFYQEKLQNEGFEVVTPDKATMEHTVIPAIEALKRKDMEGAQNLLRIALQVLLLRAVNIIVLASDEMRGILPHDDPLLKKCIDPTDALARSTINWATSPKSYCNSSEFVSKEEET